MIGAILGDIIGSRFEFEGMKSKHFKLLDMKQNFITDDTYMTLAIAKAIMIAKDDFKRLSEEAVKHMRDIGNRYQAGYGTMFSAWLKSEDPKPYNSFGNGSAMRVSPCGLYYDNEDDVKRCALAVTLVTHNHEEGLKAAEAVALAVFLARNKASKQTIKERMKAYYTFDSSVDDIRTRYIFTENAKQTVPEALTCFFESHSYVDAIRNAVSLGGDADTLACITGSVAGLYYKIPEYIRIQLDMFIYEKELLDILNDFEKAYNENTSLKTSRVLN